MSGIGHRSRLEQLLVEEATEGLSREQLRELEALLGEVESVDRTGFQLAAAAIDLAFGLDTREEMPLDLAAKVKEQAAAFFQQ